jgi:hypothetical protein
MREAARTVSEAGFEPLMSEACVERQAWAAQFSLALEHEELAGMLDAIIETNRARQERMKTA